MRHFEYILIKDLMGNHRMLLRQRQEVLNLMARMAGIKKVFSQKELRELKAYRMKIWCVCECVGVSVYVCVRERENGIKAPMRRKS